MIRPLPSDTRDTLEEAGTPSNFGLAFHRYLEFPGVEEDLQNWVGAERNEEDQWQELQEQSREIFSRDGECSTEKALEQLHARYDHILELRQRRWGPGTGRSIKAEVAWRLLIGLSAPSVLNNGITLHPLFGFPYLPERGIKGLLRHFRLTRIAEKVGVRPLFPGRIEERKDQLTPWEKLEDLLLRPDPETNDERKQMEEDFERLREDMDDVMDRLREERQEEKRSGEESQVEEDPVEGELFGGITCELKDLRDLATSYRRAFGSPNQRGRVNFFDALPTRLMIDGQSLLERDVVTPHNREYHTEGEPPADYHDPVPVQMLAVRQGVSFVFRMTCRGRDAQLLDEVHGWLEDAIEFWGAGARTRAGYGELIVDDSDEA